jgi:hypothetical protein
MASQRSPAKRYVPDEVSGVCLPAPASDTLDELRPMFALKLARSAQRLAKGRRKNAKLRGSNASWVDWLQKTLTGMNPFQLARAFDPPLASYDLSLDSETEDKRSTEARAAACVRYAIGVPDGKPAPAVPIPSGDGRSGTTFFLPHLRVVVRTNIGPLAVTETHANTSVIWTDGFALTVPRSRIADPLLCEDQPQYFWTVPEIQGFPVLNYAPEAATLVAHMQPCAERRLADSLARATRGLRFLKEVWPAAYFAAVRHVKGLILLEERGYTRSHSPLSLLGVVAITATDEASVGDLIVHEASHVRLNLMRQFDPLWQDREPGRLHESPWRQDARPLAGIILGVHAFMNVARYYRQVAIWRGRDAVAETLFERQRVKVRLAWERAKAFARPTALGERFFSELEKEVLDL